MVCFSQAEAGHEAQNPSQYNSGCPFFWWLSDLLWRLVPVCQAHPT